MSPDLYCAGATTTAVPGFLNCSRSLPVMPRYCTKMMRGSAHSPFAAKLISPTTVLNGVLWMYSARSEEHTSELQSRQYLVCRLLLEKKKHKTNGHASLHDSPALRVSELADRVRHPQARDCIS